MRNIMLLLLLGMSLSTFGQLDTHPWCPPGATWVYSQIQQASPVRYIVFAFQKDTIYQGQTAKKIIATSYNTPHSSVPYTPGTPVSIYMYEDAGKVYTWLNSSWLLLYDFNANTGDFWILGPGNTFCTSSSPSTNPLGPINVDTVFNYGFQGAQYSAQLLESGGNWNFTLSPSAPIILKNIGSMQSAFPVMPDCLLQAVTGEQPLTTSLEVYGDSLRGFDFVGGGPGTSYIDVINGFEHIVDGVSHDVNVFPNPATQTITIDYEGIVNDVWVYNALGQLVLVHSGKRIDITKLPRGYYALVFKTDEKIFSSQFIKQ